MIEGVAVRFKHEGAVIEIRLPKPNRHCHCFEYADTVLGLPFGSHSGSENQGFYNSAGQYLNRIQAMAYAKRNKQEILVQQDGHVNTSKILFSEDVW